MAQAGGVPIIAVIAAIRSELPPHSDPRVTYGHCGIGLQCATAYIERLCRKRRPQALYFVGTAGALTASLMLHTLIIPHRIMRACAGAHDAGGTGAPDMGDTPPRATAVPMPADHIDIASGEAVSLIAAASIRHTIRHCRLLTADTPIIHPHERARLYTATAADAVDMESYGVATVAARHGVPLLVIKCISDRVGDDLRGFGRRAKECATVLGDALSVLLQAPHLRLPLPAR